MYPALPGDSGTIDYAFLLLKVTLLPSAKDPTNHPLPSFRRTAQESPGKGLILPGLGRPRRSHVSQSHTDASFPTSITNVGILPRGNFLCFVEYLVPWPPCSSLPLVHAADNQFWASPDLGKADMALYCSSSGTNAAGLGQTLGELTVGHFPTSQPLHLLETTKPYLHALINLSCSPRSGSF